METFNNLKTESERIKKEVRRVGKILQKMSAVKNKNQQST